MTRYRGVNVGLSGVGQLPPGKWLPGDVVRDTVTLTIPADAPAGEYRLMTGFYSWPDLVRATVVEDGGDAVELMTFQIPMP